MIIFNPNLKRCMMFNEIPLELVSNLVSIILVGVLIYNYLKYKKQIEVIQKLDTLKSENQLTQADISYIKENEKEYKEKSEKAEALVKLVTPIFILIVGVLFIYLTPSEAMIHLNAFVVAFILVQLEKVNKKNTFTLLRELRKETKEEEK
jgi:Na+/H+ antiporter NhaD/arsenite permease-like protein